jgi:hypothetical protein
MAMLPPHGKSYMISLESRKANSQGKIKEQPGNTCSINC